MSRLTVASTQDMGPLEVSIFPSDGEPIEFTLSSGKEVHDEVLPPGHYAVIARRPNGVRLRQMVELKGADTRVDLATQIDAGAADFMEPEVLRGQVAAGASLRTQTGEAGATFRLLGSVGRALDVVDRSVAYNPQGKVLRTAWLSNRSAGHEATSGTELSLQLWRFGQTRWLAPRPDHGVTIRLADDFLKVFVPSSPTIRALGLIAGNRTGPIIMLPPFSEDVEVTFLARGLDAAAGDRAVNLGGLRAPVALVTPANTAVADLLAALVNPGTVDTTELWKQTGGQLAQSQFGAEQLEVLLEKYDRPAEALLAAHYLLRFLPERLPLDWADKLLSVAPTAADGPVIAAWMRMASPPEGWSSERIDEEVDDLVRLALARPVTLFARTRTLLFDALSLTRDKTRQHGRRRLIPYRRYSAFAGGFECIWGASPSHPGLDREATLPALALSDLLLEAGIFSARRRD